MVFEDVTNDANYGWIIPVVIVLLVVIILVIVLLNHFVISRNRYKKEIKELDRKYSYLDALLIGQDSQYIHRLEVISHTNLLFVDQYNEFTQRFKEVFDGDDKFAESMIKQVKSLINNNQYKNMKNVMTDTRKAVAVFENNVTKLDNDLYNLIKPEEEARHTILELKEEYRNVKQTYYACANDLEYVSVSFSNVFDKLDQSFTKFEEHIESGEYEEAENLIPVIRQVVKTLEKILKVMPNLCVLTQTIIPNKIEELAQEYADVEKTGAPLYNLSFKQKKTAWHSVLTAARRKMVNLQINGVKEMLDQIQNEIGEIHSLLSLEKTDKNEFDVYADDIYNRVVVLEKTFVKICSVLPEIRRIYVISQEHEEEINNLSNNINNLGIAKRTLDNYVHSSTKQPYSVLKSKLDELKIGYETVNKGILDFKAYIDSLKTSSEEAHAIKFAYYYRCKQIEKMLRDIDIPEFSEQYTDQIEKCYAFLNDIDQIISVSPIDVTAVNEVVEQLKSSANAFFDEVENKYRECQLAESAIMFGNRDRIHQMDLHQKYCSLEKMFFAGEFMEVYHEANDLYHRLHAEENSNGR